MSTRRSGALLVISGPSGTGKTSICREILRRAPGSRWSVSATTRAPRGEEKNGRDYHFVDRAAFERMKSAGQFLETAEYLGELYGTPRALVEQAIADGALVLLEIDVQGAAQVAAAVPESIRVFVLPPTRETLEARLAGRHTESEAIQRRRLAEADGEIWFARSSGVFTHFVTNDILSDSVDRILNILDENWKA